MLISIPAMLPMRNDPGISIPFLTDSMICSCRVNYPDTGLRPKGRMKRKQRQEQYITKNVLSWVYPFLCVNGKPFPLLQHLSAKKLELPKRPPEDESKTGSKTVLLLSPSLDKNGQNLHCSRSIHPWHRLSAELKKHRPRFKSSHLELPIFNTKQYVWQTNETKITTQSKPLQAKRNLNRLFKLSECFWYWTRATNWPSWWSSRSRPVFQKVFLSTWATCAICSKMVLWIWWVFHTHLSLSASS